MFTAACIFDCSMLLCLCCIDMSWVEWVLSTVLRTIIYTVSQKKRTAMLRLIWHNFTNSQYLLIIFGRESPYSILNWYDKNVQIGLESAAWFPQQSSNSTHPNSEFLADFEQRIIDRARPLHIYRQAWKQPSGDPSGVGWNYRGITLLYKFWTPCYIMVL